MPGTAVLYTRVSSKDQGEGFSLAAQGELLEAYAKEHGLKVVGRFEESETAKAGGTRPAFAKMVEFLRPRTTSTVLLVEKTDRLYRNLKDWITLDDLKVEIHFVKEGTVISPTSHSSQKFLHGIKVLMAKNYVENLSEEIRKGMTKKAKEGAFPSVAPTGYVNVPDKTIGIAPDPKLAPIVRSLFEKAAAGTQSAQELTRWARVNGLRSKKGAVLAKDTICTNILRNPAYTGSFRWGGKVYEGKYEALISKSTFDRTQRALDGRSRAKGRVHEFTYAGLVKCGTCGGLMSGDLKKGRYVYYRCAGTKGCKRFYPEKLLEAETLQLLASLQIDEAVSEWILAELERLHDRGIDEAAMKRLVSRRKALQGLQAKAYEEKLLGKIDEGFWAQRNAAWQAELAEINTELAGIENAPAKADLLAAARKPVELLQAAPTLYVTQDSAEKAKLLKTMVSNYTITDGKSPEDSRAARLRRDCQAWASLFARLSLSFGVVIFSSDLPISCTETPVFTSAFTRRSIETVSSAASIFATRGWLERTIFATSTWLSPARVLCARSRFARATFTSMMAMSSERPRNAWTVVVFQPAFSSRAAFVASLFSLMIPPGSIDGIRERAYDRFP